MSSSMTLMSMGRPCLALDSGWRAGVRDVGAPPARCWDERAGGCLPVRGDAAARGGWGSGVGVWESVWEGVWEGVFVGVFVGVLDGEASSTRLRSAWMRSMVR